MLQALLLSPPLGGCCKIQKVIHIAEAVNLEEMLGRTGSALLEHIANSDAVILHISQRGEGEEKYQQMRRVIKNLNPGVPVYILKVALYFLAKPVLNQMPISVNAIMNVFLGIILQAIPFLLLGVLLSSLIQIFIPRGLSRMGQLPGHLAIRFFFRI